jgi:hypothetical protein
MLSLILQLAGIATVNAAGYMASPAAGIAATGLSVIFVGLAAERAGY